MSEAADPPRRAKGHRPYYFDDPAIDQLYAAFLALAAELSVAFDRIDTLERMLERQGQLRRADLESYEPEEPAAAERAARRAELIERFMRPFREYRESRLAAAGAEGSPQSSPPLLDPTRGP